MEINNHEWDFPTIPLEELINDFGWESISEWTKFWEKNNFSSIEKEVSSKVRNDWIWGLLLPLLSNDLYLKNNSKERKLIGLSALPGTGKTYLGTLIKKLSSSLNMNIVVISIDDFYLQLEERESLIKGNPWNVSRGFPGTHSTDLMLEKLLQWKDTGILNVPVFDKSLRNGLGDRSHWITDKPDLVILEGWFLCVEPLSSFNEEDNSNSFALTSSEVTYRSQIQKNLTSYINVWKIIDKIWHLKPREFNYMDRWKIQQEEEMLKIKGSALVDKKLFDFIRMLNTSIPKKSFDLINSDFLVILNEDRKLNWVGLTKKYI